MLKKYAIASLKSDNFISPEIALGSTSSMEQFRKLTAELKRVAPKSSEFVYFVCRAIHAMEAANFDPVTKTFSGDGHIIRRGNECKCEVCGDSVEKWQNGLWHSKKQISPYINQNGDAFPEAELLKDVEVVGVDGRKVIKAYETFRGRGLFVNHASDDVEKIRGIILDAVWDPSSKGVDILVACDKVAYPELARQIETGYSNDVSMGTQVQFSLCSVCGNRAVTEADYCDHVKGNKGLARAGSLPVYEINNGLNFIEISVVANGADPRAKIKTVLAALNRQVEERESKLNSCISPIEGERIRDELRGIQAQIQELLVEKKTSCSCSNIKTNDAEVQMRREARYNVAKKLKLTLSDHGDEGNIALYKKDNGAIIEGGSNMTNSKQGYFQGGGGLNDPAALPYDKEDYVNVRDNEDKQMVGEGMEPGNEGLANDDLAIKEKLQRASLEDRRRIRQAIVQKAYFQGGGGLNDPAALPYDKEDYVNVRDNEDKQMVGQGMEPGNDGLAGDDLAIKEQLHRAKLRARFVTADKKENSTWTVFAGDTPIITATARDLYADDLFKAHEENTQITNWDWVASEEYGKNLIRAVKSLGFDEVKAQINKAKKLSKTAQELPPVPPPEAPLPPVGEPLPEEPKPEEEKELGVKEQMTKALDTIEDALHELRALNEGEDATVDTLETELDLGEAGDELKGLGEKLELAKTDAKLLKRLSIVMKEAVTDASKLLKRANSLLGKNLPTSPKIEKVADKKEEKDEKKEEKEEKKEEKDEKKDEKKDKKDEKKDKKDEDEKKDEKEEKKEKKEASLLERKTARYALAAELSNLYGLTDGDMIDEAHPQGGTDTKCADEKLEGDAHIETVKEQQEADLEVAEKQPRGELTAKTEAPKTVTAEKPMCDKCNKPAFACECKKDEKEEGKKVEEASLSNRRKARHEAVKGLMTQAEVDSEAKAYYKEMFSESSTGTGSDPATKAFGKEMTEEFAGKKSTAETHELKTRMKRAYKVALKQQAIGQVDSTQEALEQQVERLVGMDTSSFEAFEDVIEHTNVVKDAKVDRPLKKSAGAVRVGLTQPNQENLNDSLSKLNWS